MKVQTKRIGKHLIMVNAKTITPDGIKRDKMIGIYPDNTLVKDIFK